VKNINFLIEKHSDFLNKNTTFLTNEDKFFIYKKEVLDKQSVNEAMNRIKSIADKHAGVEEARAFLNKYDTLPNTESTYSQYTTLKAIQDAINHYKTPHPDLIGKLKEIIQVYEVYLEFLNDANQEPIKLASIHGYKCPKYIIDKGKEYRNKIEQLTNPENQDKK